MRNRLESWWYDLQDSLWFIPAVMTALAVVLALAMVRIDQELLLDRRVGSAWLFGGGSEGARGVLAAIAGTMIGVTGVVFSITIVALQLASSQFTPRVLRAFTGDRGNQVVLGVFIGTFTYSLLVLRAVRSASDDRFVFVPSASVTVAILLAIISIGFLIYFVHHSARSIQAAVIIERTATDTRELIDRLFPSEPDRSDPEPQPTLPSYPPLAVRAKDGGYLQSVDGDALFALAEEGRFVIRVDVRIGEFVLAGMALASVWPAGADESETTVTDEVESQVRHAFQMGPERTLANDLAFGFRQLADIAIKALSPGINDPTTATICIDQLGEELAVIGRRKRPVEYRTSEDGTGRLVVTPLSFDMLVQIAFAQIRHYGAGDATVAEHLAATLGRVAESVPLEHHRSLARQARLLLEAVRRRETLDADIERVRLALRWVDESGERDAS